MTNIATHPGIPAQDPTLAVLDFIKGSDIERNLVELARIGGTRLYDMPEIQPERYAVGRVALSEDDGAARKDFIGPLMEKAGMSLMEHPLGLIGTLPGHEPDLPPLIILSHTDSVPRADMYDGTTGVIAGIKVVEAMTKKGVRNKRTIHVMALTGEESSGFNFALFGSRGIFHGLSDEELDARRPELGSSSIRETLGSEATEIVKKPIVGPGRLIPAPYAVVELHVEQNNSLEIEGFDLGVVKAIAASTRYKVEFGTPLDQADTTDPVNASHLKLTVRGKSDHSGATPMGESTRADGLAETAKFLLSLLGETSARLDIGDINIEDGAINKVPGLVNTGLRIVGDSAEAIEAELEAIRQKVAERNQLLGKLSLRFGENPITIEEVEEAGRFFGEQITSRQIAALKLIVDVQEVATDHGADGTVGTVGTYTTSSDGTLILGVDVRGIYKEPRDEVVKTVQRNADDYGKDIVNFGEKLTGSGGDPVILDRELVETVESLIKKYNIGTYKVMNSGAGHDAQNARGEGYPTIMIFCQSNAGGVAHNPDAYTEPDNLEKGARTLGAFTVKLTT